MSYLGVAFFLIGVTSQGLLFWRGSRRGGLRPYSFYFFYLSYTLFWTVAFLFFPHTHPLYAKVYWDSALVAAVLRFFVVWEVSRSMFRSGTMIRKVAGTILVFVL